MAKKEKVRKKVWRLQYKVGSFMGRLDGLLEKAGAYRTPPTLEALLHRAICRLPSAKKKQLIRCSHAQNEMIHFLHCGDHERALHQDDDLSELTDIKQKYKGADGPAQGALKLKTFASQVSSSSSSRICWRRRQEPPRRSLYLQYGLMKHSENGQGAAAPDTSVWKKETLKNNCSSIQRIAERSCVRKTLKRKERCEDPASIGKLKSNPERCG